MPAAPDPVLCSAWSPHAADLAEGIAPHLEGWEESPALQALVLDGALLRLAPGLYAPADLATSMVRRAILLGCAVGPALRSHHVVAGWSACWVHTGGPFRGPIELLTTSHRSVVAAARVQHGAYRPEEVERIGGAPVTTAARTAVDLLRRAEEGAACDAVVRLIRDGSCTAEEIRASLRSVIGMRHARRAGRLLEEAERFVRSGPGSGSAQAEADADWPSTTRPSAVTR